MNFNSPQDAIEAVSQHLRAAWKAYAGAQFRFVFFHDGTTKRFVTAYVFFREHGVDSRPQTEFRQGDHGRFIFVEYWCREQWEAVKLLSQLLSGEAEIEGHKIESRFSQSDFERRTWPREREFWIGHDLRARRDHDATWKEFRVPQGYLVRRGANPYYGPDHAINDWIFNRDTWDTLSADLPDMNTILVFLPDLRVRILSADWRRPQLYLEVELKVPPEKMELQILYAGGKSRAQSVPLTSGEIKVDVPTDVREFSVLLLDDSDSRIVSFELDEHHTTFGKANPHAGRPIRGSNLLGSAELAFVDPSGFTLPGEEENSPRSPLSVRLAEATFRIHGTNDVESTISIQLHFEIEYTGPRTTFAFHELDLPGIQLKGKAYPFFQGGPDKLGPTISLDPGYAGLVICSLSVSTARPIKDVPSHIAGYVVFKEPFTGQQPKLTFTAEPLAVPQAPARPASSISVKEPENLSIQESSTGSNIRSRLIGHSAILAADAAVKDVDINGFVRRLLLFDKYVLVSIRLQEFPHLLRYFGYEGLRDLLAANLIEVKCECFQLAQSAQTALFGRPALPPYHYRFDFVDAHDRKKYIHDCLQVIGGLPDLNAKEVQKLKRQIVGVIRPLPEGDGKAGKRKLPELLPAFRHELLHNPQLLHTAVAMVIQNRLGVSELAYSLTIHQEAEDTFSIETDIAERAKVTDSEAHKVVEWGIMGVANLSQQIAEMKVYSALNGFRDDDLQLFRRKLEILADTASAENKERNFERVSADTHEHNFRRIVAIAGLPEFRPADGQKIDVERLLEVRSSKEAAEFRRWLYGIGQATDEEIRDHVAGLSTKIGLRVDKDIESAIRCLVAKAPQYLSGLASSEFTDNTLNKFLTDQFLSRSGIAAFVNDLYPSIFGLNSPAAPRLDPGALGKDAAVGRGSMNRTPSHSQPKKPTKVDGQSSLGAAKSVGLTAFLCHASNDKSAVRELYNRLKGDGFRPWLDEENLLPGQNWNEEIRKAVRASDVVIVCLSKSSVDKEGYVQKEITFALDVEEEKPQGTIFIIPARLEDVDVPERLKRWHWVDLFNDAGYERLARALKQRQK